MQPPTPHTLAPPPDGVDAAVREATRAEEKALVLRAQAGDKAAFGQLLKRYERRVWRVAMTVVRNPDDAKDVCQEAFWKAHNALHTFDNSASFFSWMYRITINHSIDWLRKKRGIRVDFDEGRANEERVDATGLSPRRLGFDPHRALEDQELRAHLQEAVDKLSPAHRAVLLLREVDGLSYQEMADTVGCSIGTIMSRLFYARKMMQLHLAEAQTVRRAPVSSKPEDARNDTQHADDDKEGNRS